MKIKICKYCKVYMVLGKCIESNETSGVISEFSYYDKGKLIDCLKCPECGHSEDLYGSQANAGLLR